ncbi:L-piperidine-6-carboxylate dehydrogenase [Xanthovirga aplysinae]|uniref:L-piperidine-6-carboxylate dehydrogenase n=1 Tax=Xanthovirga aplysinae TaxID=2529853 RepID=UPI0012BCA3B5|nr:aldehyde dehydrogenase family protein [Xanthovirga aplysinae]MTI31255.1 aldehyde dehydrogenase family protein [Xanthovirga aplysinae]
METINEILIALKLEGSINGLSTGLEDWKGQGPSLSSYSPVGGELIGEVNEANEEDYEKVIATAQEAAKVWRDIPAPQRGEIVRQMGNAFRTYKEPLGKLVSLEMGKSLQEGLGEVQEMIDICDFAVGLSRQLYGLSMHSERPSHRMLEQWHPLGVVGIISAFNFPVAVWSWNAMISFACGNACVWKPSEKTPFSALACQKIIKNVLKENKVPEGVSCLIIGQRAIGEKMANDSRLPLISATGSTRMGKAVGEMVGKRLGKSILELGGNNAIIVSKEADLKIAIPGIVFGAVGTAGQRCTTTRRLIVHEDIYDALKEKLVKAYGQLRIGNPLDESNHVGPLIDTDAVKQFEAAIEEAQYQGGKLISGGKVLKGEGHATGCYVTPALIEASSSMSITKQETFAPILYLMKYSNLEEAITIQNDVPQGLSSAIFTLNMREAELFLSQKGSDCGIANVNIGTSGAEIGGAFGGEKETGGGRESGSDAWKAYMRRQTCTSNWSTELPLAQGITFDL